MQKQYGQFQLLQMTKVEKKKLEHDLKQGKDSLFTIFEDLEYGEIEELILLNGDIEEEEDANLWGELDKRMDVGELQFPKLKKLQ